MRMTDQEQMQAWVLMDEWYERLGRPTPDKVEQIAIVTMVLNLRALGPALIRRAMDAAMNKGVGELTYVFGICRSWREGNETMVTRPTKPMADVMPFPSADMRQSTILRRIQEIRAANTHIGNGTE